MARPGFESLSTGEWSGVDSVLETGSEHVVEAPRRVLRACREGRRRAGWTGVATRANHAPRHAPASCAQPRRAAESIKLDQRSIVQNKLRNLPRHASSPGLSDRESALQRRCQGLDWGAGAGHAAEGCRTGHRGRSRCATRPGSTRASSGGGRRVPNRSRQHARSSAARRAGVTRRLRVAVVPTRSTALRAAPTRAPASAPGPETRPARPALHRPYAPARRG